jgi:DNA-binding NtrC family response regulator
VILLLDSEVVQVEDLPPEVCSDGDGDLPAEGESLRDVVRVHTKELERDLIRRALEATGWNVTHTAQRLGLSRKGLQLKLRDYGLKRPGRE